MKLIILDIDGTITDFYTVDHRIISEMYKNPIVKFLDKILWMINSLDVISNNFSIFRLRIMIYSLLSLRWYKNDIKTYSSKYIQYAPKYFEDFIQNEYKIFRHMGYKIILLTCDPFDIYLNKNVIVTQDKKRFVQYNVTDKYSKVCVIGNNYMDDIRSGLNLRKKSKKNIRIYYVGKSKLLKSIVKNKNVILVDGLKNVPKVLK